MPDYINYNGNFFHEDTPIVGAGSRGLRYGDGIFETMKMIDSELRLESYHFERLFNGLRLLKFSIPPHFIPSYLKDQVIALMQKNKLGTARIRLNVFRKNGGLYDPIDNSPDYVIEGWKLAENYLQINENGLIIDIYEEARKACDQFSSIKSNNSLIYAMAAFDAKERKLNDCLLLNTHGRVCDSTIANVFCVKDGAIYTPPLSEGCVAGVVRRHLLEILPRSGFHVHEKMLQVSDVEEANEVFLTNAITGLRWVGEFRGKQFANTVSQAIYRLIT